MVNRSRNLNPKNIQSNGKYIAVWLKRDFRYEHNWLFIEAIRHARELNLPIKVFVFLPFTLHKNNKPTKYCLPFPSKRHMIFLYDTWKSLELSLQSKGIPLEFRQAEEPALAFKNDFTDMAIMLTDFKSTIPAMNCDSNVKAYIPCKMIQVDAHNIVPTWISSDKAEYMAKNMRLRIAKLKTEYLTPYTNYNYTQTKISTQNKVTEIGNSKLIAEAFTPKKKAGHKAGMAQFQDFVKNRLKIYINRNDPTINALSGLSVYVNSGAISVQHIVYTLDQKQFSGSMKECVESFIEEIWIRRELAENFCFYKKNYLKVDSAWNWAKELMTKESSKHTKYTMKQMENAETDDPAWNASQIEMMKTGKMHSYMRMYWAKQIAEWSPNRQVAMDIANYLNDKYELDGSDVGGYTGVGWSIIGIHDRNFYGKFRPMTLSGLKKKGIDINAYIEKYLS